MIPTGKYVSDYNIFSYMESIDIKFKADFEGIPEIKISKELRYKSIIQMTRKTFDIHVGRALHFNTVEDYLEVINDPDLILLDSKQLDGNKIRIVTKRYEKNRNAIVILYTNISTKVHSIASGYIISQSNFNDYLKLYHTIWEKEE